MGYSTLTRYMRLAVRLWSLLGLDDRLPLEWLLPGAAASAEVPAELRTQYAAAKRKLARLLREHWNFSRLQAHVDGALGLRRLPHPGRGRGRPLDEALAENTRRELADFLRAGDLPLKREALRRETVYGFLESRLGRGGPRTPHPPSPIPGRGAVRRPRFGVDVEGGAWHTMPTNQCGAASLSAARSGGMPGTWRKRCTR
jgi:hypothetical protein